jgi:F0F1-type ATP synthase membrane subunit b/b'
MTYDFTKFHDALENKQDEIRLDIKRAERRLLELREEEKATQIAIDNVKREHLKTNDKY